MWKKAQVKKDVIYDSYPLFLPSMFCSELIVNDMLLDTLHL